jgi:hypothetical protein
MLTKLRPGLAAFAVFLVTFIVYLMTMDPGVSYIDSGELATVCARLGIAHPTGYPLFTLVGWFFSKLPIAATVIARLNIMAALFTAAAAGGMVLLVQEVSDNWWAEKRAKTDQKTKKKIAVETGEVREHLGTVTGIVGGLIASFNLTWWQQGTSLEVYALHILLITLALCFFLRFLRTDASKDGFYFAITLGLAFTNHLTTILLAPAMLYAFFARFGLGKPAFARIGKLALPFAAMLLIYLYLPLRAANDPILNWGNPSDWTQFWKHVTGGQYKIWMFTGKSAGENWSMFWSGLTGQFSLPVALLALTGIPALISRGTKGRVNLLAFMLLLFFGCLLYAINYDINDIQSYFLLAYLAIAVMAALGIEWIIRQFITSQANQRVLALTVIGLIAIGVEFATNYAEADESGNTLVEDYTLNVLNNLPKNAIIYSTQWDFFVSSALYYQLVEGVRPDVTVVDKHLLRDRPWYFAHLKQRAPEMMKRVEPELNAFLEHLVKFDRGEPFNEQAIGPAYLAFSNALIERNQDRPIFITSEMLDERDELFAPGMKPNPRGVSMGLNNVPQVTSVPTLINHAKGYNKRGYYPDNTRRLQAMPLALTAARLSTEGNIELSKQYYDLAIALKPAPRSSYDDLLQKERDFAQGTDAFFQQLEQMRAQLNSQPNTR